MRLAVADIDFSQLTDAERWTLENVIPRIEDGFDIAAIAAELGRDADELQDGYENLAARIMALSGRNELPPHSDEELAALEASLLEHGQRHPILRGSPSSGRPGQIVDGETRLKLLRKHKTDPWIVDVDGTAEELDCLGLVLNVARRHLNASSRRRIIKTELLRRPELANAAIAAKVGVSDKTVASVRRDLEATSEIPRLTELVGADGKTRPAAAAAKPAPHERPIRVLVKNDDFEQLVGSWVECEAFRLVERRPGVYELQVRTFGGAIAPAELVDQVRAAASTFAEAFRAPVDATIAEFLGNASEIFGREISTLDELHADEAEWAIARLAENTDVARKQIARVR